ncbi:MAG: ATP-binding protein [Gemmataceae bacterium]|nr:ATP-binding protein [Gemmataceae bacterium]
MIASIRFQNFRILKKATLPLGSFTIILGPNGSGKSTALLGLEALANPSSYSFESLATIGLKKDKGDKVVITVKWSKPFEGNSWERIWPEAGTRRHGAQASTVEPQDDLHRIRVYRFDPSVLVNPTQVQPNVELGPQGEGFAGVLDRMQGQEPERFDALNREMARLLPEYDRIVFAVPNNGQKSFALRTARQKMTIPARNLSHGTLYCLAYLTLAHGPDPPPVIGVEEPDHGIHPRLLREIRDALYRLSYPEKYGEQRPAVQVIATTHSPYFLDLFKDHPEEVVLAERTNGEARFQRLSDRADLSEILGDAPLGEVWYSGVLGGVPAKP